MKILYVASFGGHWVQLLRLSELITADESVFVSTWGQHNKAASYYLEDFSVRELWAGLRQLPKALRIVKICNPDLIVSTGAAPGLLMLFAGFLLRRKTLWVDSIANSQRLSLSCRAAQRFATRTLTQWPQLETRRVHYLGKLL
ncbi:UDP-N-acetylglucosamine transferase subunit ALG14 [Chromohalobacter canadensis]|uniref:Oligosaccharide biosynthesis protein Alg14 n=1 Tax=Chromohalobacter canadensis TaxID=141389 RepID=A0ABZ0YAI6_9GAMM|nr:UDP-N-acetylglucosamine transferase subunit ALG14 [Chromohalobacter canadensis]MCK0770254.1 oligosaccharide biosynthesis protein Alg14 [Chromohalobacter canadensis]WQH08931.1 oligosaccharide biosynthesis protein Alg14 [Chromohalobacter canadensis]